MQDRFVISLTRKLAYNFNPYKKQLLLAYCQSTMQTVKKNSYILLMKCAKEGDLAL